MSVGRANQRVMVASDRETLMDAAATYIADLAARAIAHHGTFSWVLSGGSTPQQLYELLASERFQDRIDWQRVHFFWGDERCVPAEHPDSNYGAAKKALLDVVLPPPENVHRMHGEDDPTRAAESYERVLREFLDASGARAQLDLVLLGMGTDGHTASLFPGATALSETSRWVVATQKDSSSRRLTMTAAFINRAAYIAFLVAGVEKADRLAEALRESPPDSERLPVQLIEPGAGEVVWLVDAEAGGRTTG